MSRAPLARPVAGTLPTVVAATTPVTPIRIIPPIPPIPPIPSARTRVGGSRAVDGEVS